MVNTDVFWKPNFKVPNNFLKYLDKKPIDRINVLEAIHFAYFKSKGSNFKNIKFEQNDFTNVLSITDIEDHEVFFDELHDLCEKNKIPMTTIE